MAITLNLYVFVDWTIGQFPLLALYQPTVCEWPCFFLCGAVMQSGVSLSRISVCL